MSDLPAPRKIRVLVVEDSPTVQALLEHILNDVPDFQVVGVAQDGERAVAMVCDFLPDVITMDIHMPKMDGFEATRRIMETRATPIVIVSASSTVLESTTAVRALGAGAVAIEARPVGFGHPNFVRSAAKLVETLRLMAGVKVIRRWAKRESAPGEFSRPKVAVYHASRIRLAAIGASTGGPAVLLTILSALPQDLPFPVVIVQHICDGFVAGLVEWLDRAIVLPVQVAQDHELLRAGHVYLAPSGAHLRVTSRGRALLDDSPPQYGVRPSVDHLFRSVALAYGREAVAVLLTGMGTDGAGALGLVKQVGGITVAQDEASSVVHGMPGTAIRMGAADHVLSPEAIGPLLRNLGTLNSNHHVNSD